MFWRKKKEINDNPPFVIVGLGNPGPEYALNRHNAGFLAVDEMARQLETTFSRMQSEALVASARHGEERLVLAKPRTYMNRSGSAVRGLLRFYKAPLEKLLVLYDDVDLPFGSLRLRAEGGSAGQKGMKSIIENLGGQDFARLRVGVGRPKGRMRTPDHVLQDFSRQEREELPFVLQRAAEAGLSFVSDGIVTAMNKYNAHESDE
ncbi:MAG: aminoacyl-tRNA hydrolase [Anaerolineales bacterium]|nr:aminoacyl-tRNA hydrolase [Anaerolineales bacterium]MCW5856133.1 aminoacyl-tRNA hydrolase [Anaerolineales bacterium]